ncbi:MAG: hypothetical protein PHW00_03180 [Clostridia bacterium]|nr:hypothetical protein [Clostridia bacterium]
MQEFSVKNNPSGLTVHINGVPQAELIPQENITVVAQALNKLVDKHFGNKQTK